jgi:hypothetical protein
MTIAFARDGVEMWRRSRFVGLLVAWLASTSCAASDACIEVRFEDGVHQWIRREYIVSIDARLEALAPREVTSITLRVPLVPIRQISDEVIRIRVATMFYKLDTNQARCQLEREEGDREVVCYTPWESLPLQMEVTFRPATGGNFDSLVSSTQEIARELRQTALACD